MEANFSSGYFYFDTDNSQSRSRIENRPMGSRENLNQLLRHCQLVFDSIKGNNYRTKTLVMTTGILLSFIYF